jgi:hypothetical protein
MGCISSNSQEIVATLKLDGKGEFDDERVPISERNPVRQAKPLDY